MFVAVDGSPTGIIAAGLFYSVFGILLSLSDHRRGCDGRVERYRGYQCEPIAVLPDKTR
jgi:hypothetical protein